jgi:hypothetical protein
MSPKTRKISEKTRKIPEKVGKTRNFLTFSGILNAKIIDNQFVTILKGPVKIFFRVLAAGEETGIFPS